MKIIIKSIIIITVLWTFSFNINYVTSRGVNGGIPCAVCTIVSGFVSQLVEVNNETILETSVRICKLLPEKLQGACNFTISLIEDILPFDDMLEIITPDVFCYGIDVCYVDPGEKYCNLFPLPKFHDFHNAVDKFKNLVLKNGKHRKLLTQDICSLPVMKELCELLYEKFEDMKPAFDVDGDGFSIVQAGRGSFWRGRDCWDIDSKIYPGREPSDGDRYIDRDCNGIYGVDENGISYQEQLCKAPSRGVIVIGDSTCARFRLPEAWMDPELFSADALSNITDPLFDELDWPQLGFGIGFMNSSYPVLVKGVTDSIYLRLKERNRCNHRDYQNLCRNGDSSFDTARTAKLISRNATTDKPALVLFGVVGNDVCNNAKDTLANMTTPEEFRSNILAFLSNLPQRLPPESHVVLVGLADGSFLYSAMAERIHPLGRHRGDITYKDVYNWFLCMSIGPCNGWLTSDGALRKNTSRRAMELSDVLKDIVKTSKFPFKLHYVDNPFNQIIYQWMKKGKKLWHLIEPVDGFHPNQVLPNKSNEQPSEQEQSETQVEDRSAEEHSEGALPCTQQSTSEIETPRNTVKRNISSSQSHPSKTKNRKTAHDYEINFMSAAIDKLQDISNRASQVAVNKDDSYDCFGKYVASMLRSIGPPTAMRLQQTITNMLTNTMCPPENPSDSDHSRQATSGMESTGSAFSPSNDEDYYFLRDLDNNHLQ